MSTSSTALSKKAAKSGLPMKNRKSTPKKRAPATKKRAPRKTAAQKKKETIARRIAQQKEQALEALEKTLGIKSKACKIIGISRETLRVWINDDPVFAQKVQDIKYVVDDFVKDNFLKSIRDGDGANARWYMATLHHEAPAKERPDLVIKHTGEIHHRVQGMTDAELLQRIEEIAGDKAWAQAEETDFEEIGG